MALTTILGILSLLAFSLGVELDVPAGYVLEVSPTCTNGSSPAQVVISSDLNVKYDAVCAEGTVSGEISGLDVSQTLDVLYTGGTASDCKFKFNAATGVYKINLILYWGEPGSTVVVRQSEYVVTCATGDHKTADSGSDDLGSAPFLPPHLISYEGASMSEAITLSLVDIRGDDITGNVVFGRKVQLKGSSTVQMIPVDCEATSGSSSFDILRSGCGDGLILLKDQGFLIDGNTVLSPIFEMFKIESEADNITFSCKFVKCSAACAGSSCTEDSRAKRSADSDAVPMLEAESEPVRPYKTKSSSSRIVETPRAVLLLPSASPSDSLVSGITRVQSRLVKPELSPPDIRSEDSYFRNMMVFYLLMFLLVLAIFSTVMSVFACYRTRSMERCQCQKLSQPCPKI